MKVYLVGGAVRDELLGLTPKDLDYVVVGSSPEELLSLGYHQVGAGFPVFLHPDTGDEYALARTEAKDGDGYHGFSFKFGPEVTLKEDLSRRDLTINAMAKCMVTGDIIDPFGGQKDLVAKVLRPTTYAFSEDPVRALRAARFLSRFPEFEASQELILAVSDMESSGELSNLVPERVWLELQKSLTESVPSRFFRFLCEYTSLFPEINAFKGVEEHNKWHPEKDVFEHIMLSLDYSSVWEDPVVSFGVLCHDLGKPAAYAATNGLKSTSHESLGVPIAKSFCERLRAPTNYTKMACTAAELHTHVHLSFEMKPKTIHKLFKRFKDKGDFTRLLSVAESDKKGRGAPACDWEYLQPLYLYECWLSMEMTDTKSITSSMEPGPKVGEAIRRAQIESIAKVDKSQYVKEEL